MPLINKDHLHGLSKRSIKKVFYVVRVRPCPSQTESSMDQACLELAVCFSSAGIINLCHHSQLKDKLLIMLPN